MKKMTRRMWRSVVSTVLALTLVLGMATSAFAAPAYVDRDTMEAKVVELYNLVEDYCAEDADAQAILDEIKAAIESEEFVAAKNALEAFLAEQDSSIDEVIDEIVVQINALNEYLYVLAEENPEAVAEIKADIAYLETVLAEAVEQKDALYDAGADALAAIEEIIAIAAGESDGDMADAVKALQDAVKAADDAMKTVALDVEAIDAAINEAVVLAAEIKADIESVIAEIEASEDEIRAEVEEAIAEIEAALDAIDAAVVEFNAAVEEAIAEIQAIVAEIIAEVEAAIDEAIAYVEARIEAATTCDYEVSKDSQYLAIGDKAAADYASVLAGELEKEGVKDGGFIEAAADEVLDAIVANEEKIAASDLITLGLGNAEIVAAVKDDVASALLEEEVAFDWAKYVGEENVAYVEDALVEVEAYVAEALGEEYAGYVAAIMTAIESYAYNYTELLCGYPEAVNAIKAINPNAQVIIVGMYNPFAGVVIDVDGEEIAFGEYVDYIIAASNAHYFGYALLTGNAIYVDAPAVENDMAGTYDVMEFADMLLFGEVADAMAPTVNGDAYIAEQILAAMNITKEALLGDADGNGEVDIFDVLLLSDYVNQYADANELDLSVCDLDGEEGVDIFDVLTLSDYVNKFIKVFPVEQ